MCVYGCAWCIFLLFIEREEEGEGNTHSHLCWKEEVITQKITRVVHWSIHRCLSLLFKHCSCKVTFLVAETTTSFTIQTVYSPVDGQIRCLSKCRTLASFKVARGVFYSPVDGPIQCLSKCWTLASFEMARRTNMRLLHHPSIWKCLLHSFPNI